MRHLKTFTFLGLGAVLIGSLGVFLQISVARGFLPGMVELSVAFGAGGTALALTLLNAGRWKVLAARADQLRAQNVLLGAAGVAVLAMTAGLAVPFERFPWPVTLLAGAVLLLLAAASEATAPRETPAA